MTMSSLVSKDDTVDHPRYGHGVVLAINGNGHRLQAQIAFADQTLWIVVRNLDPDWISHETR